MNSDKIILDLCGGTGSWSKPYREAGYDVRVITLPEHSVADWWQAEGTMRFRHNSPRKDGMGYLEIPMGKVYGILAAPPCTQFSIARTNAKLPRDLTGGMLTVESCLRVIWNVQTYQNGKLKFWALENPVGILRRFLGRPETSFKQWEYGDGRDKPTDIWGFFNEPRKIAKQRPDIPPRWGKERVRDGLDRAAVRAMTPQGFANAFFKANQ